MCDTVVQFLDNQPKKVWHKLAFLGHSVIYGTWTGWWAWHPCSHVWKPVKTRRRGWTHCLGGHSCWNPLCLCLSCLLILGNKRLILNSQLAPSERTYQLGDMIRIFIFSFFLQFWRGAAHTHMLPHEACQVGGCFWLLADFLSCCWASILLSLPGFALICCPAFGLSFVQLYSPRFALLWSAVLLFWHHLSNIIQTTWLRPFFLSCFSHFCSTCLQCNLLGFSVFSKFLLEHFFGLSGDELCFLLLCIIAQILCSFHSVSLICKSKGNHFFPFPPTKILWPSADYIQTFFLIPFYSVAVVQSVQVYWKTLIAPKHP